MKRKGQKICSFVLALTLAAGSLFGGMTSGTVYAMESDQNTEIEEDVSVVVEDTQESSDTTEIAEITSVEEESTEEVSTEEVLTEDVIEDSSSETLAEGIVSDSYKFNQLLGASSEYNVNAAYDVLKLVNQQRANNGLSPLKMDIDLYKAAMVRAKEISTYFSHTRPDGTMCYTACSKIYGENIAAGYPSASSVMAGWMESEGHRANILTSGYTSIGIACYFDPNSYYGYHWVQVFGYNTVSNEYTITDAIAGSASTIYNGVDYSAVYDFKYYVSKYSDIKNAYESNPDGALAHFVNNGMKEGRQGCANFNVTYYKNRYVDLRNACGKNLPLYYKHYMTSGKKEGRDGKTACTSIIGQVTKLNGVDYSAVYNYDYYLNKYSDLKKVFNNDDIGALTHFVNYGMKEGRQGCASFNVISYAYKYYDLRKVYKNDKQKYYLHYIKSGKKEGRVATGTTTMQGGPVSYSGVNYSAVFNVGYYANKYADLRKAFGFDDAAYLKHFVNSGMNEGRQGSANFNVLNYKNRYKDLQRVFGNDLKKYYIHYINAGKKEGRNGK
ncbi:MAG: CAP domain-containing protein [Lachnospiraceae bacterium]